MHFPKQHSKNIDLVPSSEETSFNHLLWSVILRSYIKQIHGGPLCAATMYCSVHSGTTIINFTR